MAGRLRGGDAAGAGRGAAAALAVAVGLGVAILVLLSLFGERLICLTGCAPNLVAPALTYLRVRMLAAPAVVITMVAQVRTLPAFRLPSPGLTDAGMLQQEAGHLPRRQAFQTCPSVTCAPAKLLARLLCAGRRAQRTGLACSATQGRCTTWLGGGCAQAGLLAQKDSVTPCVLVGLQCAVNAAGSFALVAGLRLGLPGVAAATVAGQWLGAVLLLRALCATPVRAPPAGRQARLRIAIQCAVPGCMRCRDLVLLPGVARGRGLAAAAHASTI